MDAFQLRNSYNSLNDVLAGWRFEVRQVLLGVEPSSVQAVAGLGSKTLDRFTDCGGGAEVAAFKGRREALQQTFYQARDAVQRESDPKVALNYFKAARSEAEAARSELSSIAKLLGVDLSRTVRAPAAEDEDDALAT